MEHAPSASSQQTGGSSSGKGNPVNRRSFLRLAATGAALVGAAAGGLRLAAEQKAREAASVAATIENGGALERGLRMERVKELLARAVAEYLQHIPLAERGREAQWRTPPAREDLDRILAHFATIVRVEGSFADWLERGGEMMAEAVVRATGSNPAGIRTFGPAEVSAHTALLLARRFPWMVETLVAEGIFPQEAQALLHERNPAPEQIAHTLRLFDAVGAVVWGGLIFTLLAVVYGRAPTGAYQLHNARAFSLAWSAYSARPTTPAVAALQNVLNEVGWLLGVTKGQVLEVDGAWGPQTQAHLATLRAALREITSREREAMPRKLQEVIQRGTPPLEAAFDRIEAALSDPRWGEGAPLEAARASWEVQHQAAAIQRALWQWVVEERSRGGARLASLAPFLTPIVLQRYSTMMESYEALRRTIDAMKRALGDPRAQRAHKEVVVRFRNYLLSDSDSHLTQWRYLLESQPHFTDWMTVRCGGVPGLWSDVWNAWWDRLVQRVPERWGSDGRWLGTVPTFRRGGLLAIDRNIPARLALAWELAGSPYAIGSMEA